MSEARTVLGVGIIGTGFMGQAHAMAWNAAGTIFPDGPRARLVAFADVNAGRAAACARQYGAERSSADWQSLIADPAIDVISITTPNDLHKPMALAAIAAGKHVHCEKPLAPEVADARLMMEAAEAAGILTQVGYNYIKNPMLKFARSLIEAGELGQIVGFRAIHAEDFMADPAAPYAWRLDAAGGPGVLADLGSHVLGMARYLLGPILEVNADLETVFPTRPRGGGSSERVPVAVPDAARMIVQFSRGCRGSIETSWVATGRKMQLAFEVTGTKATLAFTQERLNELRLYRAGGSPATCGFTTIEAGPAHAPYGNFCVAPGHQLGFNDLKTIEMAEFLAALGGDTPQGPDFREAWEIQKLVEAAVQSSRTRTWVAVG